MLNRFSQLQNSTVANVSKDFFVKEFLRSTKKGRIVFGHWTHGIFVLRWKSGSDSPQWDWQIPIPWQFHFFVGFQFSLKRNLKLVYGDLFFMVSLGCQLSHNKKDNLDRWLLRIPHTNRSPLLVGNSSTPSHFGSCSSPWLQAVASVLPKATNDGETPSIFSLVEA